MAIDTPDQKPAEVPQAASAPNRQSLKTVTGPVVPAEPYGAPKLEDTSIPDLTQSLQQQLASAGLPKPKIMNLHPGPNWKDPTQRHVTMTFAGNTIDVSDAAEESSGLSLGHTTHTMIIGNRMPKPSAYLGQIIGNTAQINEVPVTQQPANQAVVMSDEAINAFVALHETIHYVAYHITQNGAAAEGGIDLNVELFDHLNNLPPQTAESYISTLKKDIKTPRMDKDGNESVLKDKLVVAKGVNRYIYDKIADAGAALYALSNYGDTESTKAFLKNWENLRKANYPDLAHNTSSSIEAAIDSFSKNPRTGMSIVEAAQQAAQIIDAQPDLHLGIDEMAHQFRLQNLIFNGTNQYVRDKLSAAMHHTTFNPSTTVYSTTVAAGPNLSTKDKANIKNSLETSRKAAQTLLGIGPSSR